MTTGITAFLMGLVALYVWAVPSSFLSQWISGSEQMASSTSLCLVLAGAGLMFSAAPPSLCRRGQVLLGAAVCALAGIALFQHALDLPVSESLRQFIPGARWPAVQTVSSNRMTLQTAAVFALTGGAMILINMVRSTFGAVLTAIVILGAFFIVLANGLALLLHPEVIPRAVKQARMLPFTTIAVLMVGIGLLVLHVGRDRSISLVSEDRKIVLLSGGLFLFAVLFAGLAMTMMMRHEVEEEFAHGINRSLHDRIELFRHDQEQALSLVQSLSGRPLFRERLAKVAAGTASRNDRHEVLAILDSAMTFKTVSAVRLIDANDGTIGVRGHFPSTTGVAVKAPSPYRAELVWDQGYRMKIIAPLSEAGRLIGAMETVILLPGLTGVVQSLSGLGDSGEMLVCALESADQMGCFPSRHRPQGMVVPRNQSDSQYLPMYHALNGEVGMMHTLDYRQKQVIAAFGPIGATGLGMVLKKDVSEVYQPFHQHVLYTLPLLAGLVFVGVALTRWWVLPLARELVRAKDRMQTVLDNVADGIIVFDRDGSIVTANPAARRIFCRSPEEIARLRVQEILPGNCRDDCRGCRRECSSLPQLQQQFGTAGETTGWRGDVSFPVELAITEAEWEGRGVFIAILRDISQRVKDQAVLRESERRLRELSAHLESVREEERTRIAREMHDELGQLLTALKMDIAGVRSSVGGLQPALADEMQSMSALVDTTIESVRRIAADLRPAVLDLGLVAALEWLAQRFETHTGIACVLDMEGGEICLDMNRTAAVYRILQESLTNVARHAGATSVVIALGWQNDLLRLTVQDNGKGIDADSQRRHGRFGLIGIRERVHLLGGELRIEGLPGKGTTLAVQLPLDPESQEAAA